MYSAKLIFIVLGATILQKGNALQCYECEPNAKSGEMCGSPDYGRLVDCNSRTYQDYLSAATGFIPSDKVGTYNFQVKCGKITLKNHGKYGYVRKCMLDLESLCSIYKEVGDKESVVASCNFCDTDGCNLAPTTHASILFLVISFLVVICI